MKHSSDGIKQVLLDGRTVGPGRPALVIAEAGVNHNGSVKTALEMVKTARRAGADVVKFQTYRTELLVTGDAAKADYQEKATGSSESQYEMLKKLELSFEDFKTIMAYCKETGIAFLSTAFDEESAGFLDEEGMDTFKIPSGEATNLPLLRYIAQKNKPIIFSTGMCSMAEVKNAVQCIRDTGNEKLVLLHCVSGYPANPASVNLRAMETLASEFHVPVGYSDHTAGNEIAIAAVAMGACIIEKHFTLDRNQKGPDHQASMEPGELEQMIRAIRNVEVAAGDGCKKPAPCEASTAKAARKSVVSARDLSKGTVLSRNMLTIKRPGTGLSPALLDRITGCVLTVDVKEGTLLSADMLDRTHPLVFTPVSCRALPLKSRASKAGFKSALYHS